MCFFFLQKVLPDITTKFWCVGFCLFVFPVKKLELRNQKFEPNHNCSLYKVKLELFWILCAVNAKTVNTQETYWGSGNEE